MAVKGTKSERGTRNAINVKPFFTDFECFHGFGRPAIHNTSYYLNLIKLECFQALCIYTYIHTYHPRTRTHVYGETHSCTNVHAYTSPKLRVALARNRCDARDETIRLMQHNAPDVIRIMHSTRRDFRNKSSKQIKHRCLGNAHNSMGAQSYRLNAARWFCKTNASSDGLFAARHRATRRPPPFTGPPRAHLTPPRPTTARPVISNA